MLNSARKSLHYYITPMGTSVAVSPASSEIFYVVNSEMVGCVFAEMAARVSSQGDQSITFECRVRRIGAASFLLATATLNDWTYFKKTTTAANATYKLVEGDIVYIKISAMSSVSSTPPTGFTAYVTFK